MQVEVMTGKSGAPALPIFPVKNKRPLAKGWQNSLPVSLDEVIGWEPQCTGCGWAAAIRSDTIVVDCDNDPALSTLCDIGPIPSTLTTLTPRGFHLWFNKPDSVVVRNNVGVMPGVDVRTKGGYV